ncbi:NADPH-dependent F420 reductase [Dickeya zeae]|uniref:NADPH-dependent F420 reductase n=1 Tax=Dickeya zeae TaxID=204042 RepID=UPI00294FF8CC|nr:NAD(P)-binding domain-containing protein [Dickeya zeae]
MYKYVRSHGMKIGIIGAGAIGAELARKLSSAGHVVRLANSRDPESLVESIKGTNILAVTATEAAEGVQVVILSLPFNVNREAARLLKSAPADSIIIDTSNYYPFRDGEINDILNGKPETVWVSEQVGKPVIKAWNALGSGTLKEASREPGAPDRLAIPMSGDNVTAKQIVAKLVNDTGFDVVDAGPLAESWRQQPGTPAYCTELAIDELKLALAAANAASAPKNRDALIQAVMAGHVATDRGSLVAANRNTNH